MAMKNKKILVLVFFLILNFLPQIFVLLSQPDNLMNWYLTDDAFYYFKTAQNIAEGNGITFDGLASTNGFHPLWMVICVPVFALARYDLFLPLRVIAAIQILMNAASGYLLYSIFSKKISKTTAWIVAIFWMFYSPIHELTTKSGLETGLNAFMLIVLIYALSKLSWGESDENHFWEIFRVGLCGAGVLLSRLDNIFILIMAGVWLVFRGKRISNISQIDFLLILVSVTASFFFRLESNENIFDYLSFLYLLIGFSLVIKPTLLYLFQCYESDPEKITIRYLIKPFLAISLSSGLIFIILYVLYDVLHVLKGFPRSTVMIDWVFSLFLIGGYHLYLIKRDLVNGSKKEDVSLKSNWRVWMSRAVGYFSPISITLIIYLIFNYRYAGTAMPVSGQIKRWWGTLPNTVYGQPIKTFTGVIKELLDPSRERGPFWLLMQPLGVAANKLKVFLGYPQTENVFDPVNISVIAGVIILVVALLFFGKQSGKFKKYALTLVLLPILTGALFHAMSYKSTGYLHAKSWYWIGEMILIILFLSILLTIFLEIVEKRSWGKKFTSISTLIVCGVLWGMFSLSILQQFPLNGKVPLEYDIDGEVQFIRAQTKPGDVIGMTGGGLTAYFVPNRTILNLDGLINSADYFRRLQDGEVTEYLIENNMKYVYGEELIFLDSDPYRWIFSDTLTVMKKGPYFYLYAYQPITTP
jgi:hypothetical protein